MFLPLPAGSRVEISTAARDAGGNDKRMKIVVGLGNPGLKYRNTRHNAGFLVIKAFAAKYRVRITKHGFGGEYGIGSISGREVMFFRPMTYMNLSGEAVKAVVSSKLSQKDDLLLVSDDVDLVVGSIRLREKGSSGGHNGLQSVIDMIGPDFARLRIGIKPEGTKIDDMASFVLSGFTKREKPVMDEALNRAVGCVETWIKEDARAAMAKWNT